MYVAEGAIVPNENHVRLLCHATSAAELDPAGDVRGSGGDLNVSPRPSALDKRRPLSLCVVRIDRRWDRIQA